MQEFTTRERCEAGAQKVTELITNNRQSIADLERTGVIRGVGANDTFIIVKSCVEK
ncbi:MAG TPA: hypothetical protein VGS13_01900 [Stellaceae bacterium]|nr:hypothetical protein [Stellaceae bacterium]